MNNRIDELLEKYWTAETSLAEEQELKILILQSEEYESEKELFHGLGELAQKEPVLSMPAITFDINARSWMGWAASIALLVGTIWGYQVYEQKQKEEQAYREVMQAFALIHTNLSKGQEQLQVMNEFRYLNTTTEIFGGHLTK
jgi:hypothetical protein